MLENIKNHLNDPRMLERLYRQNPDEFSRGLDALYTQHPDSILLRAWWERLHYQEQGLPSKTDRITGIVEWALIILLAFLSGTYAKYPEIVEGIKEDSFYPRNLAFFVLPALGIYFAYLKRTLRTIHYLIAAVFVVSLIYINLLPSMDKSDSIVIACIHLPFLLWALTGLCYIGGEVRNPTPRLNYLRFNGELIIYTTIILLAGVILTGITVGLFSVIKIDIFDWYMRYVVIYGMVAAPLVAVYIITHIAQDKIKIAPIVGKIFSPLFLITFVIYLIAMVINGKSPYSNREFLLIFNFMLVIVLGLLIFVLSERPPAQKWIKSDIINIGLLIVVLILDAIALSAIAFRLSSYGLTPNRIVVLGANLLIFINLSGILFHYCKFLLKKTTIQPLEKWIGDYLTVYTIWVAIVVFSFPVLFSFK
ncbi:DUF4153 domain-containing protein [candidate division KSB1 bacterium]|nr:DUF4153 domain-containing protein [candidate division KSB1 bacterium]